MLPQGYDPGVCRPVLPPVPGALATADCGQSTLPGGPAASRYSLFGDQGTLRANFEDAIAGNSELFPCPNSERDSPTTWHYTDTPGKVEGSIACGLYEGGPDISWTKNDGLLLGNAQGATIEELHQWWLAYG